MKNMDNLRSEDFYPEQEQSATLQMTLTAEGRVTMDISASLAQLDAMLTFASKKLEQRRLQLRLAELDFELGEAPLLQGESGSQATGNGDS